MPSRRSRTRTLETLETLELEREALDLAQRGYTIRRIADVQGCAPSIAHKRLERALDRLAPVEEAEMYRRLLGDQLDEQAARALAMQDAAMTGEAPDFHAGIRAGELFVRVADRLAKLRGLDAPVRADVKISGALEAEVESLVNELSRLDEGRPPGLE